MHKKIASEIAIGVLLTVVLVFGAIFWIQGRNMEENYSAMDGGRKTLSNDSYKQAPLNPSTGDYQVGQLQDNEINYEDCGSIPDLGSNTEEEGIFVYSTLCRLGSKCNTNGNMTSIVNYYIRNFEGTFHKKIFTSINSLDWTTYDFYPKKERNGFDVISSTGDKFFVSNSGSVDEVKSDSKNNETSADGHYKQEVYSSNKQRVAKILSAETSKDINAGLVLEVYESGSGGVEKYDLSKYFSRMSGMYIDSWSKDSRYVYVAGGIYEFSAPAVLLRIDTEKKKVMSYEKLKGMVYPVTVFAEQGVAFVIDKEHFGEEDGADVSTNIFALDLATGDIKKIVQENGSISPIVASYTGRAYYGVYQGEDYENQDIRYIDIAKKTVHNFLENAFITKPEFKSWAYTFEDKEGEYFSFKQDSQLYIASFNDINNKKLLGEIGLNNCRVIEHKKEYLGEVLSWTK